MKKAVLSLVLLALYIIALTQVPESFNYQVVVRDGVSNDPLINQNVSFRMSILKGSNSGESQYSELHIANTGELGIVNLIIGNGTGKTGSISTIDWGADSYFLRVEIDKTGGTAYVEMGITQLLSVPYALYSKNAQTAAEKSYVDELKNNLENLEEVVFTQMSLPANGLIAYYPFNGNANDEGGNGQNGTVNGASPTTDRFGNNNSAYNFDHIDDYIVISDNNLLDFTNSFSMCAWFAPANSSSGGTIVGKPRGTQLTGYALAAFLPNLGFAINDGSASAGAQINSSSYNYGWHFMVGTYDGAQMKLYLDNVLMSVTNTNISVANSPEDLYIGCEDNSWRLFGGKVDDIRLYNRALTPLEIRILYYENGFPKGESVGDIDENFYKTVKIGTQFWMAENLKTTKYNDGTVIPFVTDNTEWSGLTTPGYCWYGNDEATYKATYGALYNWYTVSTGKLCPSGWHVPTDAEWTELTDFLGGLTVAGGKLKETGTVHWTDPNTGATNETGFTSLGGGYRFNYGTFDTMGINGAWWSTAESSSTSAWDRDMRYYTSTIGRFSCDKKFGFSVRCIKD